MVQDDIYKYDGRDVVGQHDITMNEHEHERHGDGYTHDGLYTRQGGVWRTCITGVFWECYQAWNMTTCLYINFEK